MSEEARGWYRYKFKFGKTKITAWGHLSIGQLRETIIKDIEKIEANLRASVPRGHKSDTRHRQ